MLVLVCSLCVNAYAFDKDGSASTTLTMYVYPNDVTPPEVTISIGKSIWKSFINAISFNTVFSDTQVVKISANDEESGVDKVFYTVRSTVLTLDTVEDDSVEWAELEKSSFSMDPCAESIIYVKATDHKGNVGYYSSDGFIICKFILTNDAVKLSLSESKSVENVAHILLVAYDNNGHICMCRAGKMDGTDWKFDKTIAAAGTSWKCFLLDDSYKPTKGEIRLNEIKCE